MPRLQHLRILTTHLVDIPSFDSITKPRLICTTNLIQERGILAAVADSASAAHQAAKAAAATVATADFMAAAVTAMETDDADAFRAGERVAWGRQHQPTQAPSLPNHNHAHKHVTLTYDTRTHTQIPHSHANTARAPHSAAVG